MTTMVFWHHYKKIPKITIVNFGEFPLIVLCEEEQRSEGFRCAGSCIF